MRRRSVAGARTGTAGLVLSVLGLLVLLAAASPTQAGAQGLRVTVLDSTTRTPLSGALVALLDDAGTVAAEGLTAESGSRNFRVPAGRYRVRIRRIGFRPYLSSAFDLSERRPITVAVQSHPIALSTIVISARARCRALDADASQSVATVWGEATKALEASRLTLADLRGIGSAWRYTKAIAPSGNTIESDTTYFIVANARPFGAREPDTLAAAGYVVGDRGTGWSYYGPDESVLLSSSFVRTHCFKLVRERSEPGLIGVAFEPVRGRKTADIAGVVWLDERTNELRRIVFKYVNAGLISLYGGGGETHFQRLPSGAWIVSSWHLRAPTLADQEGKIIRLGALENGGGLLRPD